MPPKKQTMSFEEALSRLDEIVRKLESGDMLLSDSLSLYEEGTGLIKTCSKMLDQAEQKVVDVSGRAYFNGDICPDIPNITSGSAIIFEETREILQGFKRRNPDGTVNHTEVQFK